MAEVDDLTEEAHLTSRYPYGYHAEYVKTLFFNVCNGDDGKTWSTPWGIDDPAVYIVRQVAHRETIRLRRPGGLDHNSGSCQQ